MVHSKINDLLEESGAEVVLVNSSDTNFYYLTGMEKGSMALLGEEKIIIASSLSEKEKGFNWKSFNKRKNMVEFLKKKLKGKRVGLNFSQISKKWFDKISNFCKECVDISSVLNEKRSVKTKKEIKQIEKACKIAEGCFGYLKDNIELGMKEEDVKREIKKYFLDNNVEQSFEPIVAFGKGASVPHYNGNQKIKKGRLLVDLGCKYNHYCSDLTKMFSFVEEERFEEMKRARNEIINFIEPGKRIEDVQNKANELLGKMDHSIMHGVGLEVHDFPKDKKTELKENMVFSLEPAVYENDFGMRLEDMLIIKKEKNRVISSPQKSIINLP